MEGRAKKVASTSDLAYIEAIKPHPGDDPADALCVDVLIRIRTLLRAGKGIHNIDAVDKDGQTALHHACKDARSVEVVRALVDSCGATVNIADGTKIHTTPYCLCVSRDYGRSATPMRSAIIAFLKERGANIDFASNNGYTYLMASCERSFTATHTIQLIQHGANVNAVDSSGVTSVWYALLNRNYEVVRETIAALFSAGATIGTNDVRQLYSIIHMLPGNRIALLAPYVNVPVAKCTFGFSRIKHADPIGAITEASRYGVTIQTTLSHVMTTSAKSAWACLRIGTPLVLDSGPNDVFLALGASTDRRCWQLFVREWGPYWQHPITRETILHLAVRRQPTMLSVVMAAGINPLLLDKEEKSPAYYTNDATMLTNLRVYSAWTPQRFKTHWYGPYFEMRAVAFALVCKHWSRSGVRVVSKDIQHHIIRWIASYEYTYVVLRK